MTSAVKFIQVMQTKEQAECGGCCGCVAEDSHALCWKLPTCPENGAQDDDGPQLIWVVAEADNA